MCYIVVRLDLKKKKKPFLKDKIHAFAGPPSLPPRAQQQAVARQAGAADVPARRPGGGALGRVGRGTARGKPLPAGREPGAVSGDGVGSVFTSAVGAGEQGRRPEGIRAVITEGEAGARPGLPGVRVNMEGPGAGAERALPALKMAPRSRDGGGGERSWARGCVRVAWRGVWGGAAWGLRERLGGGGICPRLRKGCFCGRFVVSAGVPQLCP